MAKPGKSFEPASFLGDGFAHRPRRIGERMTAAGFRETLDQGFGLCIKKEKLEIESARAQHVQLLRQHDQALAAANVDGDRHFVGPLTAQLLQECLQQRRRQVVYAEVARIFQHVEGNGFAGAGQAADDDDLHACQHSGTLCRRASCLDLIYDWKRFYFFPFFMTALDLPFLPDLVALRRDLHAHPELAFEESRTADIVARELSSYGLEVHRDIAKTGVVGVLRASRSDISPAIGLRADMDALPLEEKNTFSHASCHAGKMHACGHDGHTAMLLGAARYLAEHRDTLNLDGTVYFIFQPAEESEGGAAVMIEDGLFDRFPMQAVYGLHNWPGIPVGEMAIMAGPVMAGTCAFEITVRGHGCHAAMPNQGVDTLLVASHLVVALQSVVSRNLHPCDAAVVSVTQFQGGVALNIIPDQAQLRGTLRSFKPAVQQAVEIAIRRLCDGLARTFDAHIDVCFNQRYPATVNSPAETALCQRVADSLFGAARVRRSELPSMGAEDFSYMLQKKPGCYAWLGNGPEHEGCSLHNPNYDFNDELLSLGINYWVHLVRNVL